MPITHELPDPKPVREKDAAAPPLSCRGGGTRPLPPPHPQPYPPKGLGWTRTADHRRRDNFPAPSATSYLPRTHQTRYNINPNSGGI